MNHQSDHPLSLPVLPLRGNMLSNDLPLRAPPFLIGLVLICCLIPMHVGKCQPSFRTDQIEHATNIVKTVTPAIRGGASNEMAAVGMDNLDDKYRLAIGDQIRFRIVQDDEESRLLAVNDAGEVEFPYVGHMPVAGKTCRELAGALKLKLEEDYYYHATVIIAVDSMAKHRGKVYVVGAIRTAGPIDIPSDEKLTVSRAIFRAGGFTDFADQRHVKVTRRSEKGDGTETIFTTDVKEVIETGKLQFDLQLQPDDLIYVPERLIRF